MLREGQTDRTTNMTNLTGALREYAKAPKSGNQVIKKRETDSIPHQCVQKYWKRK
jgi:hypothetical protein